MEEKSLLDIISAIGYVTTPILVLILTAIGWKYRKFVERKMQLEEKLRDDRINIYNQILEPFIILLMTDNARQLDKRNKGKDKSEIAISQMLSIDYRKVSFKLFLLGSDSVESSFNDLMQYFYNQANNSIPPSLDQFRTMMSLLGAFLLKIRKSMENGAL
ncbi:hypothetical protein PJV93_08085 [Aliarcobacter butzleri]|uniref:DUF4760 domain-containing protein n=1 Tax=Aliarcobacter butzleri TaxID=28197 RepID=A0AAW7QD26_9BACT|nr:hypothetical protein [Aliarcobacter butzleri]MDN5107116.1 hypothetical protein [Aliarcobacter butzleri]MDN5123866.1 hypothetical protein [Aliarcobacter butzleri]